MPADQSPRLLEVLAKKVQTPPPVWLMRQAGRYLPEYLKVREQAGSFLGLCYTPRLASEVTLQPIRRFGFDAAIIFSDILVVPHALGQHLEFVEGEGPKLEPVSEAKNVAKLSLDGFLERLGPVFEAIELTVASLGATPLIGFCGAPWTVASYMIEGGGSKDHRAAKLLAYQHPSLFGEILDLLVEASARYLIAQVKAGAQALQIFDSWALSLSDADFDRFVIAPTAKIIAGVKAACPGVPVIGFPRGSAPHFERYVTMTGVDALGCDTSAPLELMARCQELCPVQGNLDPILLLAGGDAMGERVRTILAALAGRPFIFNLGHGILPETPIHHVDHLLTLIRSPQSPRPL